MLRQSDTWSSQPPMIGPSAIATPVIAPHKPIARARSPRSVNTLVSSDSVEGNTIAAPTPITAARRDQRAGAVHQPARQARQAEDRQAGEQHPLAPEPVRQAARGQHRPSEQQD